jgi:hypothetical protein
MQLNQQWQNTEIDAWSEIGQISSMGNNEPFWNILLTCQEAKKDCITSCMLDSSVLSIRSLHCHTLRRGNGEDLFLHISQ